MINISIFHKINPSQSKNWADINKVFFRNFVSTLVKKNMSIVNIEDSSVDVNNQYAITFDDGHISDYEIAYPLLAKNNLTATFFIVPKYVGRPGYMNWEEIKVLSSAGMEIASHSLSHPYFSSLKIRQVREELEESRKIIEDNLGKRVSSFAYPYGDFLSHHHDLAQESGYKKICTSTPGMNRFSDQILMRNSIHSKITSKQIESFISPTYGDILARKIGYDARAILKRTLGVSVYLRIKSFLYRN